MTSISAQNNLPNQASNSISASQSTLSYASTAKKAVSSPPVVSGSSTTSPAIAIGGSAPGQHGKSSSISPVNGRSSVPPAVPAVSGPAVAHGSSTNGNSDHSRKASVTINANNATGYIANGGPVGGSKAGIQFGSLADSPAVSHSTPQISHPTPSAAIAIPGNPRVTSPAQSPSPIPQPSASGGRPPSGLGQGNNVTFGSLGGDGDRHMRQASGAQGPLAPNSPAGHLRRESSQSIHSDVSTQNPGAGRGGFQQGGRGRGGFNGGFQPQQQGFPPNQQYRNNQGPGRGGMGVPFQQQGRPLQYPNSPHQAARSPALTNSIPNTPNMPQAMPMQGQQQFNNHYNPMQGYQNYNHGFPPAFQQGMPMHNAGAYMGYPQMAQMSAYPQSPQPGYQQYIPGQYGSQAPPMSRNSSQISEQRPTSSMGGNQAPSASPAIASSHIAPKTPSTPSAFVRAKKSAAIVIKRPDGEALDIGALKTPVSPAPAQRLQTPPVVASTPTPPPPKTATPQHARVESASVSGKSQEQIQKEIREKVAAAAGNKAAVVEAKEAADQTAKAAELKQKEEEKTKADADAAVQAKAKEEADAKAAADKAKADEEEELERQIQEMEAAEAEREKKEAEMLAKRAADKAAADKANEAQRLADAAENDRKLQEQEREMERLEDEKERKRAEAEAKENGTADEKKEEKTAPNTPSTLASKLSSSVVPETESGASTPGSDDSMGPPPAKVNIAEKRAKPAALNLTPLNTKPVEAPQPSAALQSLKSARFLSVLNSSIYPEGIASPNPALNNAVTTKGKSFKYDKEFLLQFQKVFTEKPSLEFESQIKNLIGDGDGNTSSRQGSARPAGSMGPRPGSNRNQPGSFAMGSFGAASAVGKTSAERFAMSSGSAPRPAMGNPMASFRAGTFPGGNSMSRQPSTNNMGNMPQSPRQQSNRQGRGSKRNEFQPSNTKQDSKNMPLTAGMELKPIAVTATGWKPRSINATQSATGAAGPAPSGASSTHMEPDMVQRKVKAALNKMTPEKFDKIADQILTIAGQSKDEQDGRTLRQVIQLTFEKATDEAHWASMYAKFCKRMLETMSPDIKDESIVDKNGNVVSGGNLFRKYLLNRCQEEFERGWKVDLPEKPEGERGEEKTEEAVMLSDEYYIAAAAKRRGLGLVQFIGELYKLSMLTERIMHECVKKLVDYTGIPDEAEIESLTKLLKTIGGNLDSTEKGKPMMDVYFSRIQAMVDTPDLPSRLRFMLMDIIDLRKARWVSKEANKGPLTLDEVKAEADKVAAQKAAENARGNQRGGGRMQAGRGDGRNFSGGYGNQPPPDYQKNTVGMDDLRRLTNKNAVNRQASQQMSFGPTSMFSSRSNSGRKMGSMRGLGDDSGPSSRTGTPPQQKEKESATSSNAFSLLAGLGSGEENPASPPSANTSPVLTKSTPASEEKAQDKQEE